MLQGKGTLRPAPSGVVLKEHVLFQNDTEGVLLSGVLSVPYDIHFTPIFRGIFGVSKTAASVRMANTHTTDMCFTNVFEYRYWGNDVLGYVRGSFPEGLTTVWRTAFSGNVSIFLRPIYSPEARRL